MGETHNLSGDVLRHFTTICLFSRKDFSPVASTSGPDAKCCADILHMPRLCRVSSQTYGSLRQLHEKATEVSVNFQTRSCLPGAAVSVGKPGPMLSPVESFEHERSVEKARSLRKLLLLRQECSAEDACRIPGRSLRFQVIAGLKSTTVIDWRMACKLNSELSVTNHRQSH